jgi:heavy metal sensor kinase
MRWWRSHSLRVRLTLWSVGAIVLVLGVYVVAVYAFLQRDMIGALDEQLARDVGWASASLDYTAEGGFEWTDPEIVGANDWPWVQVWSADGRQLLVSSAEARRRPIPRSGELAARPDNRIVAVPTEESTYRILTGRGAFQTRRGAVADVTYVIQVARPDEPVRGRLRELAVLLALGLPLAVGVAGLGGYAVARRALAPVERMTDRASSITAERLSDRLPVHNPDDEMGRLATVFNETLSRLEQSFDQMRRFTSDVSHELRTPLTAIRSVGEVGLRGGPRDEQGYRGIIGSMLEEVDRLALLVDRLLTLSRAESGQALLSREAVDLRALAEDVVSHLSVLAEEKGQRVTIDADNDADTNAGDGRPVAIADRLVLRQALINLVDNAIKFSPAGGEIRVRIGGTMREATFEVADSGPGISDAARPRIFDRFYHSSAGDAGGTGLGLSIARGAVEANGGRLTLERTGTGGSTFRIIIPRHA